MTANASYLPEPEKYMMAPAASKVVEGVLTIMQCFGIAGVRVDVTNEAGIQTRHGEIRQLYCAPGIMGLPAGAVKDALAEILALVGVKEVGITTEPADDELLEKSYSAIRAAWSRLQTSEATKKACALPNNACALPADTVEQAVSDTAELTVPLPEDKADLDGQTEQPAQTAQA